VNFVPSFRINTTAAANCSLFNQVSQQFSINIASVFILVKFNTVYDSFSRWKAFFCLSYFLHCCDRATKIDFVFTAFN
jgi:hypothetical protein